MHGLSISRSLIREEMELGFLDNSNERFLQEESMFLSLCNKQGEIEKATRTGVVLLLPSTCFHDNGQVTKPF